MDSTVSPDDLKLLEKHLRETEESDRRSAQYYREWLEDNEAKAASSRRLADAIASLRAGDPATLAALEARIVELEAQLAEAKAVTPAPAARTPRGWQTTHRHYKGGEYRLLDALWRESDAALLLRYEHKDGMRFARPAREFLTRVQEGETFQRRFMPMFGRAPGQRRRHRRFHHPAQIHDPRERRAARRRDAAGRRGAVPARAVEELLAGRRGARRGGGERDRGSEGGVRHSRILLGAWAGMALAAVMADSARIATSEPVLKDRTAPPAGHKEFPSRQQRRYAERQARKAARKGRK